MNLFVLWFAIGITAVDPSGVTVCVRMSADAVVLTV